MNGACAACKHQRKRCDENCQLAKYFPGNKSEEFQNVYRVFGVNNMIKILNSVQDEEKDKTAETLILEAEIRKKYPVKGSIAVLKKLRDQIEACRKELDVVKKQISFCKENQLCESSLALIPTCLEQKPNEAIFVSDATSFHGYNYETTLEEGADIKLFNNSYLNEHDLSKFIESRETSAKSKAPEKLQTVCVKDETMEDDNGSPKDGK